MENKCLSYAVPFPTILTLGCAVTTRRWLRCLTSPIFGLLGTGCSRIPRHCAYAGACLWDIILSMNLLSHVKYHTLRIAAVKCPNCPF